MTRCKSCRQPLVIKVGESVCLVCGTEAGALRSLGASTAWTNRGAAKLVAKKTGLSVRRSGQSLDVNPWTWSEAEQAACSWMRSHGYRDAKLTGPGADGGVDVISRKAVAQVKFQAKRVGLSEVQRLFGICRSQDKAGLFFSSAGYSPKALEFARAHDIQTFVFPPVRRIK